MGGLDAVDLGYAPGSKFADDAGQEAMLDGIYKKFDDVLNKLKPSHDQMNAALQHAVHVIENVISIAGWGTAIQSFGTSLIAAHYAKKYVEDHEKQIMQKLEEGLKLVGDAFQGVLAPFTFPVIATHWGKTFRAVCDEASTQMGQVAYNPDGIGWEGTAANRYKAETEAQKAAVEAVGEKCQKMEDRLREWAKSSWELYDKIFDLFADAVGKVVSIMAKLAASEDPVEIAMVIDDVLDDVGEFAAAALKFSNDVGGHMRTLLDEAGKLESQESSAKGLPNNSWPKSYKPLPGGA
jgi:uncharacterized protein YukE